MTFKNPFETVAAYTDRKIFQERERTNLFKGIEQVVLTFLCHNLPEWITPNMLTFIGFMGSVITTAGFFVAKNDSHMLLICVGGFAIQWFGDSLDGRIAYYRNRPRRWYGFALDMIMDWISTIVIGAGFHYYLPDQYKLMGFIFITSYGWTMIIALLKYKITDIYAIDSGSLGPTEFRLAICAALTGEAFFPGHIHYFAIIVNLVVVTVCLIDFYKVVQLGDKRDKEEAAKRLKGQ